MVIYLFANIYLFFIYLFICLSGVSDWAGISYFSIFADDPKYRRPKDSQNYYFPLLKQWKYTEISFCSADVLP